MKPPDYCSQPLVKGLEYPPIAKLPAETFRPFWSVMIPTYNRPRYVEQTLRSILEQDPGPDQMQIEVVDDCSENNEIEAVTRELNPGRVTFYRQPRNVGLSANWTTCIKRAHGYYIHIIHDDDMVIPGFYSEYRRFLEQHPDTVLLFCRSIAIDENGKKLNVMWSPPGWTRTSERGILNGALRELIMRDFIVCPTAVVSRSAYEIVGGFALDQFYAADWDMWLRLASLGPVGYIHQPLYLYRLHNDAETRRLIPSGKNIEEIYATLERGVRMLPPDSQSATRKVALRNASADALSFRWSMYESNKHDAELYYALWAFRLRPSARNAFFVAQSWLRRVEQLVGLSLSI